jgi:hypothetical protein
MRTTEEGTGDHCYRIRGKARRRTDRSIRADGLAEQELWSNKMSKATDQFKHLASGFAPLPWTISELAEGVILDAEGREILRSCVSGEDALGIVGAVVCAVNTLAGYALNDSTLTSATKVNVREGRSK